MKYLFIIVILLGALNAFREQGDGMLGGDIFTSSLDVPKVVKKNLGDDLVLYSAAWCPICNAAKEWFVQNNISYRDCDVEKEAICHEHMQAMDTRGVPVMVFNGKVNYGFNAVWVQAGLKSK